ncbi:hypothetical protein AOC36_05005 [Erysipelothrix larvae]|uniref:Bacterial type II secretion system protein E domain-containing protein n=1 Tax=Erysipelothrix larvae TaxID=1514105 RepID=A0A0X8GZM8_9FIRM|nr:ATPase, T2SS/T4P/T4SS family [Erysipelothrix larvae]AMC93356.1 hypothetical protein AOC36_05005 [Erysipelothrix larvae]
MNNISIEFDTLLKEAYKHGASDIHISLNKNLSTIQFRRHKRYVAQFNSDNIMTLFEYIKYFSGLELRKYQEPQSAQFTYIVDEVELFVRFAVLETRYQTHGVLRILNQNNITSLEACGFCDHHLRLIRSFFTKRNGLLLFTGATGSGKSTSMFSALHELKHKQVITLENPVEQYYDSLIQLSTPSKMLGEYVTQILRHDPDIIAVGEIRTNDELFQCLRCALTGHLVVSTMHAGHAHDVIHRFKELNQTGIPLESILYGIVHQTLIDIEGEVQLEATIELY